MRLAIIFILLIVVTGTQAQRAPFLGRVLDTEAKPIASEHVNFPPNFMRLLNNLPADRLAHAIADKQGRFRLPCHPTDPQSMGTLVAFHPQNGSSAVRLEEALPRVVRLRPLREFHGPETDSEENPVSGARLRWHMGFNEQNDTGLFLPSVEPFCVYTVQQGRIFLPLDPTFTRVHITYKAHGYAPLVHHLTKPDWEKLSREGLQFRLDTVIQLFAKLVYPHIGEPMPNMPVVLADMHLAYSDQAGNPSASVPTQGTLLRPGWNEDSPTHMHQGIYPSVRMGSQQIEGAHDFGVIEDYTQPKGKFVVQNKPMPYAKYRVSASTLQPGTPPKYLLTQTDVTVHKGLVNVSEQVVLLMKDESKTVIKAPEEVKVLLHIRTSNNQVPKQIWVMGLSTRALPQTFDRPIRSEKGLFVLQLWQQRGDKLPQMILFDPTALEAAMLRNVDPENPPKLIKLQPLPRSGGQVLNKAGKPIAGATVSLIVGRQETVTSGGRQFSFWEEQHLPINGTTDKRGRFSLPILPDTTCWALVRARGYHPDVVMLRPRLTALVRLEKGAYRYSGKLVDLYGDHLAGVKMEIQYRLPGGKQPEHNRTRRLPEYAIPLGRIQTDAQGRFAVDDMPSSLSILISPDTLSFPQHVKPSNELVLVMRPLMFVMRPHSTKGMIGPEPTSPRAKNLLKEAEWIQQPPQFNGKKTVLIFTSPHLKQNETLYQNIGLLSEEQWQVVTVFDSYNRQEVERYCRQIPIKGVVGHWKSRTRNDLPVLVTEILPTLPYVMLLDNDGNPVRYGVRPGNLLQEAGELP